jgi:hypothetical protein
MIPALQTLIDTLHEKLNKSILDYSDYVCNRWSDEYGEGVARSYKQGQAHLEDQISAKKAELLVAQEKMTAIQQVLDTKWR